MKRLVIPFIVVWIGGFLLRAIWVLMFSRMGFHVERLGAEWRPPFLIQCAIDFAAAALDWHLVQFWATAATFALLIRKKGMEAGASRGLTILVLGVYFIPLAAISAGLISIEFI